MHLTFLKNRLTIITGPEYPCPLNIFHKWYVKLRKTFIPPCVDLPAWEYIRTISKSCNIGSQFEQLDFSWWWGVCISWMCVSTYIKPYIEEQPCFRMPVFNFLDEGTCVYIDSPAGCTRLYETSLYEQQRTPTPWDGHCCWRDSEGGKKKLLDKNLSPLRFNYRFPLCPLNCMLFSCRMEQQFDIDPSSRAVMCHMHEGKDNQMGKKGTLWWVPKFVRTVHTFQLGIIFNTFCYGKTKEILG